MNYPSVFNSLKLRRLSVLINIKMDGIHDKHIMYVVGLQNRFLSTFCLAIGLCRQALSVLMQFGFGKLGNLLDYIFYFSIM